MSRLVSTYLKGGSYSVPRSRVFGGYVEPCRQENSDCEGATRKTVSGGCRANGAPNSTRILHRNGQLLHDDGLLQGRRGHPHVPQPPRREALPQGHGPLLRAPRRLCGDLRRLPQGNGGRLRARLDSIRAVVHPGRHAGVEGGGNVCPRGVALRAQGHAELRPHPRRGQHDEEATLPHAHQSWADRQEGQEGDRPDDAVRADQRLADLRVQGGHAGARRLRPQGVLRAGEARNGDERRGAGLPHGVRYRRFQPLGGRAAADDASVAERVRGGQGREEGPQGARELCPGSEGGADFRGKGPAAPGVHAHPARRNNALRVPEGRHRPSGPARGSRSREEDDRKEPGIYLPREVQDPQHRREVQAHRGGSGQEGDAKSLPRIPHGVGGQGRERRRGHALQGGQQHDGQALRARGAGGSPRRVRGAPGGLEGVLRGRQRRRSGHRQVVYAASCGVVVRHPEERQGALQARGLHAQKPEPRQVPVRRLRGQHAHLPRGGREGLRVPGRRHHPA
mmetsp:Transcript_42244/g.70456  ORF Transcript_42244/g.70456 Transcript_42244/m.70456 type:complete len:508 (-) Transcript_42244:334-1857(-)